MRLLEIVRGKASSDSVIATSLALARTLGKVGVLVGNCRGFVGNRMFGAYQREAQFLIEEGARVEQVDAALADFGMAMGPLAVGDLAGLDVGWRIRNTGYVSAWVARAGGRPVGLDNSAQQLATARQLQQEFDLHFPLLHANAEHVPLADESFDLAISEYGACIWCDPDKWVPEAARLLRPGGRLRFLRNSTLSMLCVPDVGTATDQLLRPQAGLRRMSWESDPGVEFHLGHGEWIRVLRRSGFEVEDMIEVRPAPGTTPSHPFVTNDWAQRWPVEEVWKARKR